MFYKGIVKFYNKDKGFGFIVSEESGKDVFFHHTGIKNKQLLTSDDFVEYEESEGKRGVLATNICKLG